jgi:hypothetical protein
MFSSTFAQNPGNKQEATSAERQKVDHAIKNYKAALESDNLGMIESALINVMKLKHNYPDNNYTSLIPALESLENNDRSKSIVFMSYIVKNYLLYPDRYAWLDNAEIGSDKDFYATISQKVAEQVEK